MENSNFVPLKLSSGGHAYPEHGLCLFEMVAFYAGEPHSDSPTCVCPVLRDFGVRLNDGLMSDELRNELLLPLVGLLAGTYDPASEEVRGQHLMLVAINHFIPLIYSRIGQPEAAFECSRATTLSEAHAALASYRSDSSLLEAFVATSRFGPPIAEPVQALISSTDDPQYGAAAGSIVERTICQTFFMNETFFGNGFDECEQERLWAIAANGLREAALLGRHGVACESPITVQSSSASERLEKV